MEFFDYLFYRICVFYNDAEETTDSAFTGLGVLSLTQCLNLVAIVSFVYKLFHYYPDINKYWYAIPYFIVFGLNMIRYNKYNFRLLDEKWKDEDLALKKKKGRSILLYFIFTGLLFIIAVIVNALIK